MSRISLEKLPSEMQERERERVLSRDMEVRTSTVRLFRLGFSD